MGSSIPSNERDDSRFCPLTLAVVVLVVLVVVLVDWSTADERSERTAGSFSFPGPGGRCDVALYFRLIDGAALCAMISCGTIVVTCLFC